MSVMYSVKGSTNRTSEMRRNNNGDKPHHIAQNKNIQQIY